MKKSFIIALLVMGFSGIVGQILLLRELLVTFYGNELSIGIILANWIILEAFGSLFLGKLAERFENPLKGFVWFQLIFSISLPIAIYFSRVLKDFIGITAGEGLGLTTMFYSSISILLPVSISHGALFTFGCKGYTFYSKEDAVGIGKVYIYETIGTILGGLLFTYLFIPYLHSFKIALIISFLNIILCFFLINPTFRKIKLSGNKILYTFSIMFSLLTGFLLFSGGVDKIHILSIKKQWRGQNVIHYQNSVYGNITVVQREKQYTFFADGIPVITSPTPDIASVEEFAHLPMLVHSKPREVLVISGGAGGILNEILKHPIKKIDYVELDPLLIKLIKKFPTKLTENEIKNRKVNIKYLDGRLYVKTTKNKYDLILSGLSNPSDLQINRFFTKEFFSITRSKLKKDGILVLGLPGSLTYLSDELINVNRCILNTLNSVFPYIYVIPGDGTNIYLVSESKLDSIIHYERLIRNLNERNLKVSLITPAHIEYKLHPSWQKWFFESIKSGTQKINSDFKPVGLYYSISYWNAHFAPNIRRIFNYIEKLNVKIFIIIITIFTFIFLLIRYKIKKLFWISIPYSIITTGFAAMIFQLALIFTFQAIYGYVFYWIGLLITAFMTGVAIGSLSITLRIKLMKKFINLLIKLEIAIISFSLILPVSFIILSPYLDELFIFIVLQILFIILSFTSGILVGAEFPIANKIYLKKDLRISKTAGLLYASDLLGGWIGGIIGGVILLPILGLLNTCMVVFTLKVSSLIILYTSKNRL